MLNFVFDGDQLFLGDGTLLSDAPTETTREISFEELTRIKVALEKVMGEIRDAQIAKFKENVRHQMALLGISPEQLFEADDEKPVVETKPSVAKYRDPETGKTWSGKGKRPKWFDAARADDFLIEPGVTAESADSPF